MSDMLMDGVAWLEGQRAAYMARTVTYKRGASEVEVSATVGRTAFQVATDSGFSIVEESRDFLIAVADLVLGSVEIEPQNGDRIVEVEGGVTYTNEVMGFGGEPGWRYSDPARLAWRVHTKRVETVEAS